MTGVARDANTAPLPSIEAVAATRDPQPDVPSVADMIERSRRAAEDLLTHLRLATAATFGPTAVIEAAMADVAGSADRLAEADAQRRSTVDPAAPLQQMAAASPDGPALLAAGDRLRQVLLSIERESGRLALELARRRADIDEVLRQQAGSPGIYDASGRTTLGTGRRSRGAG